MYRRTGHAEHDSQSYIPEGEIEWWAANNDPVARYVAVLKTSVGANDEEFGAIDERVRREVDSVTDLAEQSSEPRALDALEGMYADPPRESPLWFREGYAAAAQPSESAELLWSAIRTSFALAKTSACTAAHSKSASGLRRNSERQA